MARLSSDRQKWAQQSQRLAHYGRHDLTLASHGGRINWRRGRGRKGEKKREKEKGRGKREKRERKEERKQMKSRRGGEDGKGKDENEAF